MRIAVSGTHGMGKTTLIDDFINKYPAYIKITEPYHQLLEEKSVELSLEPSLESFQEQLDYSIELLNKYGNQPNVIFDRCPIDFIAYAMCCFRDNVEVHDSEIADRLDEIKDALNCLDLIVFIPLSKDHSIDYHEENPAYRKLADRHFKELYRDEIIDIFPKYGHPKVIEVVGNRENRLKIVESYLK